MTVTTDAETTPSVRLTFTAEVTMPIEVLPSTTVYLNVVEGVGGAKRLLLRRPDGRPLVISRSAVADDRVRATTVAVSGGFEAPISGGRASGSPEPHAAAGDVWLELNAEPTVTAGRHTGTVQLWTNHPEMPLFELPFTLRVRPAIEARPQRVHLGYSATGEPAGAAALVTLHHAEGKDFRVIGLEVSHPELLQAALVAGGERAAQQIIRIGLQGSVDILDDAPHLTGVVSISTEDPQRPVVEIPVVVSRTQGDGRRPVRAVVPTP